MQDPIAEQDSRVGNSLRGNTYSADTERCEAELVAWITGAVANGLWHPSVTTKHVLEGVLSGAVEYQRLPDDVRLWLVRLLILEGANMEYAAALALVRLVVDGPALDLPELALVIAGIPRLLDDEPRLRTFFNGAAGSSMLSSLTGAVMVAEGERKVLLLDVAAGRLSGKATGVSVLLPLVNELVKKISPRFRTEA